MGSKADQNFPLAPGPCDYCRKIDAPCHIDLGKRRQKPYYSVSHEEYRHMQTILRHYLPETELTLPTLRSIASQCDDVRNQEALLTTETPNTPDNLVQTTLSRQEARPVSSHDQESEYAFNVEQSERPVASHQQEVISNSAYQQGRHFVAPWAEEDMALEEVVKLQTDLGCLMADARGEYRKLYIQKPINTARI